MHIAATSAARERFADNLQVVPRALLSGQRLLIGIIAGVTWAALVGAILSYYILASAGVHIHSTTSYAAHDLLQPARTSFGTLTVVRADLVPVDDVVKVDVTLSVANTGSAQVDAPRLEDLRLITSNGAEAKIGRAGWSGPAVLLAGTNDTIDLEYTASPNAGLLWLEYTDSLALWPDR